MLLPMGFRLAVACAQAVMWALLNFVMDAKVATATCIDNVCFAGSRNEVYAAATTFLKRVEECNFTLNGMEDISFTKMSIDEQRNFLRGLEETGPEFLGEKYDLLNKTRAVSEKTITKLNLVWEALAQPITTRQCKFITHRQFFCLVGLLVYSTDVLNIMTHTFFNLFKKIRTLSSKLNKNENLWDMPMETNFSRAELEDLQRWVQNILENKPVGLLVGRKEIPLFCNVKADIYITLDASLWGWGAVFYNSQKQYLFFKHNKWTKGDYRSSAKAEPLGIMRSIRAAGNLLKGKRIAILTDHENIVFASRALFIHSFHYNQCLSFLERLKRTEGTTSFLYFLEGTRNNADGVSRGQEKVEDTTFPEAGLGLVSALPIPWQL